MNKSINLYQINTILVSNLCWLLKGILQMVWLLSIFRSNLSNFRLSQPCLSGTSAHHHLPLSSLLHHPAPAPVIHSHQPFRSTSNHQLRTSEQIRWTRRWFIRSLWSALRIWTPSQSDSWPSLFVFGRSCRSCLVGTIWTCIFPIHLCPPSPPWKSPPKPEYRSHSFWSHTVWTINRFSCIFCRPVSPSGWTWTWRSYAQLIVGSVCGRTSFCWGPSTT